MAEKENEKGENDDEDEEKEKEEAECLNETTPPSQRLQRRAWEMSEVVRWGEAVGQAAAAAREEGDGRDCSDVGNETAMLRGGERRLNIAGKSPAQAKSS